MTPNRLAHEKSPYLLQHQHNPVDWYPWGEEAFQAARELDRPIFLSIGYATCHWCHVMEHESFEDPEVAALMNEAFINIKVDREERPDIDGIYMAVAQMATGRGGWPLSILMTPERMPFFAGTYLPKESRHGMRGMLEFIPQVSAFWAAQRKQIESSAQEIQEALQRAATADQRGGELGLKVLRNGYLELARTFDDRYGGFGPPPKFPTPHRLLFLLRHHHRTGEAEALRMVVETLDGMRAGGVFDHVGFGFHRYSTDDRWLLPHFEKMLYDQALLLMACAETFRFTGQPRHAEVAREIAAYVLRDLTAPEGGFFSAEDADSEGEEGKFYVWTRSELTALLGDPVAGTVATVWGITEEGNFLDEATHRRTGANIPHLTRTLDDWADALGRTPEELADLMEQARGTLFEHRETRIRPLLDDKILTDWNGLMIAALASAGAALEEPTFVEAAERAGAFVWDTLWQDSTLLHRYREGDAGIEGNLDDYVFLAWGFLELHQATLNPDYLRRALLLTDAFLNLFGDEGTGGLFFSPAGKEDLIVRQKEIYDGAIPSGNSTAAYVLIRLARLTGRHEYETRANAIADAFSRSMETRPSGFAFMLTALELAAGESEELVIAGDPGDEVTRAMLAEAQRAFHPGRVVLHAAPDGSLEDVIPMLASMPMVDGRPTAYLCHGFRCEAPVTDPAALRELLGTAGE